MVRLADGFVSLSWQGRKPPGLAVF
jgi:hypothetical protein